MENPNRIQSETSRPFLFFLLVVLVVIGSRLPFIANGYGLDSDSWRLAHAARTIATTDRWESSRPPGHPVQEYACSLIWTDDYRVLNSATLLLSAFAAGFLFLCSRRLEIPSPFLTTLIFAFTPIVFQHSTTAMDYMWAVAFLLVAFLASLHGRVLWTAIFMTLAVGSRAAIAPLCLPVALSLASCSPGGKRIRFAILCTAVTIGLTVAVYIPVIHAYGWKYFSSVAVVGYPWWGSVLERGTFEVWGGLGTLGILFAAILVSGQWLARRWGKPSLGRALLPILLLAVILGFAIYIALPYEAGYMVPAVPFVAILAGIFLGRRALLLVALLLITSNVVDVYRYGPQLGLMLRDREARIAEVERLHRIVRAGQEYGKNCIVICGAWQYKILMTERSKGTRGPRWEFNLTPRKHAALLAKGYTEFYFISGVQRWNRVLSRLDLEEVGARPFPE